MGSSIFKLKDIFTIENIIPFFTTHYQWFLKHFSLDHFWHICSNIKRFMECRDYNKNYALFQCPICGKTAVRPNTCKSKLCPTCGKPYSDNITENFANKMINKKHRSILFSMPNYLWIFFIGNTHLLAIISDLLYKHFKRYFREKYKVVDFGFSVFFHTFGRDLKFYPHIHIIITEGGFTKEHKWKKVDYFHWAYFEKPWKVILTSVLKNNLSHNSKLNNALKKLWSENAQIYFNLKGQTVKNSTAAIKYLTRYLARPPIAEYRITFLDKENISFWYKDVETGDTINVDMALFSFIGKLLIQIPPKNFKMVRHYGLYARNINKNLKSLLFTFGYKRKQKTSKKSWDQNMLECFAINPLICSECNIQMEIKTIIWNKKVYNFKT